jgi:hypothetical protein
MNKMCVDFRKEVKRDESLNLYEVRFFINNGVIEYKGKENPFIDEYNLAFSFCNRDNANRLFNILKNSINEDNQYDYSIALIESKYSEQEKINIRKIIKTFDIGDYSIDTTERIPAEDI